MEQPIRKLRVQRETLRPLGEGEAPAGDASITTTVTVFELIPTLLCTYDCGKGGA